MARQHWHVRASHVCGIKDNGIHVTYDATFESVNLAAKHYQRLTTAEARKSLGPDFVTTFECIRELNVCVEAT